MLPVHQHLPHRVACILALVIVTLAAPTVAQATTATFGRTTVGGSHSTGFAIDQKRANKYSATAYGQVTKLSMYLAPESPPVSGTQTLKGLIYADNAGVPGALLGTTSELSLTSSSTTGWYDLTFATPPTVNSGTSYYIGFIDGGTANVAWYYFDATATRWFNTDTYSDGPADPFGTASTDSNQFSLYATVLEVPVNTAAPTISGTAQQGQTLTAANGTWQNNPTSYSYQWQHCASGSCTDISGATSSTYTVQSTDVGDTIDVVVTATNADGSESATSAQTATVSSSGLTAGATNCSSADVTWCGNFDTGDSSQWTEIIGSPSTHITFPTTPLSSSSSTHSDETQMTSSDIWTDGTNRMQLRESGSANVQGSTHSWTNNHDIYFHVSVYVDSSTTIGGSFSNPWRAIFSWPSDTNGGCSNGGIQLYNGNTTTDQPTSTANGGAPMFVMVGHNCTPGNAETVYWALQNPTTNGWYHFIVHRYFSASSTTGYEELWLQKPGDSGYTQQTFNGPGYTSGGTPSDLPPSPCNCTKQFFETLYNSTDYDDMRLGDYRNTSFTTTDTLYYDEVRASTTAAGAQ